MLIKVHSGICNSFVITDKIFESVDSGKVHSGRNGTYLKLINKNYDDLPKAKVLKVLVAEDNFEVVDSKEKILQFHSPKLSITDETLGEKIRENFEILEKLIGGCATGNLKGLVVSGAPGVGKTHEIQRVLEMFGFEHLFVSAEEAVPASTEDELEAELDAIKLSEEELSDKKYYVLIKGRITPLGLYSVLHEYKDHIIVFDDCDNVLEDSNSLNILKAALDSYERRFICWNSRAIGNNIPRRFEFKGTVIFISNIHFENIKEGSKMRSHLDAIQSRCHFLDLSVKTNREKIIRIQQVIEEHDLFARYDLTSIEKKEIIEFIVDNQDAFREISLRTALKIAEIRVIEREQWQKVALVSCLGGNIKPTFAG